MLVKWRKSAVMSRLYQLTVLCALALVLRPGAAFSSDANMVANPSFEASPSGSDENLVPDWNLTFRIGDDRRPLTPDRVSLVRDRSQAHTGVGCVRLVNMDSEVGYILRTCPLDIKPGGRYEVSFWARGRGGSRLYAAIWAAGFNRSYAVTPEWTRYSQIITVDKSISEQERVLQLYAIKAGYQGNISDPELFVDDVSIAEVTSGLADVFGSHMVLQRDKPVPVWGWAKDPGQKITLNYHGQKKSAVADKDRHWKVTLDPMPAGGPFEMHLSGSPVPVDDVMIGDVWLCTGQSNMDFGVDKLNGIWGHAPEVISKAEHPNIRLWSVSDQIAPQPQWGYKRQFDWQAKWMRCTPENIAYGRWGGFSAVGYFFGRQIQEATGVPIGLMKIDYGGTSIESWMSKESLDSIDIEHLACPKMEDVVAKNPGVFDAPAPTDFNMTSACYNGMMAPVIPYAIKGILWYQGEHNANYLENQYDLKLKTRIADLRRKFGQGNVPYLIVQLCNWLPVSSQDLFNVRMQGVREAAVRVAQTVPNTGFVVTYDLADRDNPSEIHPKNKQDVAHRLALLAEARVYGKKVEYSGPIYRKMALGDGKIRLYFTHVGTGLVARGGKLVGFSIAGDDRKFVAADAVIDGDTIVVSSPDVKRPTAVRYCYQSFVDPIGNLWNREDLPASPFRTDTWPEQ
jgi:sialate O-acetylesterase